MSGTGGNRGRFGDETGPSGSTSRGQASRSVYSSSSAASGSSIPKSLYGPRLWRSPSSVRAASASSTVRKPHLNGGSHQLQARETGSRKAQSKTENEVERKEEINEESDREGKTTNALTVSIEETLSEKDDASCTSPVHVLDTGTETVTSSNSVDQEVFKMEIEKEQDVERVACSSEEMGIPISISGVKLEVTSNSLSVTTEETLTEQVEDVATGGTSSVVVLDNGQDPGIEKSEFPVDLDSMDEKVGKIEQGSNKPDLERVTCLPEEDESPIDCDMALPPPPPDVSLTGSVWKEEMPQTSVATPPPPPPLLTPPSPDLPSPCSASNEEIPQSSVATLPPPPPPPPPPIPDSGSDAEFSVPRRHKLLTAIKEGVTLRQVPQEAKSRPLEAASVKVVDVQSELRNKLRTRRKEEVQVMKSQIDQHQERIEQVKKWILESQHNQSSLQRLQMLLEEVKQVETLVNVTPEVLRKQTSWPTELIDCIVVIVEFLTRLQQEVVKLEQLCATASAWSEGASAGAAPVNAEAVWTVVKGIALKVKSIQDAGSRYAQAALLFTVSSSDVGDLIRRAREATMSLLNIMFPRALQAVDAVYEAGLTRYDQTFRVGNSHRLLMVCCQLNDSAVTYLDGTKHPLYSDAQLRIKDLEDVHCQAPTVTHRVGEGVVPEQVTLRSSSEPRSLCSKRMSTGTLKNLVELVRTGNTEHVSESLQGCDDIEYLQQAERELLTAAVATGNCQVIDVIMQYRQSLSMGQMSSSRQFDIIHEAIVKSKLDCLSHLVHHHGFSVNCRSIEAGNSPLLIAARRPDYASMILLIRLGADLFTVNQARRNVLQLLAVKEFPRVSCTVMPDTTADSHLNLSSYINNPSLSDVVLISEEDGEKQDKFFAHRVILCAQSEVFKAMMESPHWSVAKQNEIVLQGVPPAVLSFLLKYIYTGTCLFPRDDLNLGIELLAVADRYMLFPMKLQCEAVLSTKIGSEVVIPLYSAAFQFNAQILYSNCCHYLLENYHDVDDPDHITLLHMLENAKSKQSQGRAQPHKPSVL